MPALLHQKLPHVTSNAKIQGVYSLRQPGFSPHPALRHRQLQRNGLRRSASLVLARSQSPATCGAHVLVPSDVDRQLLADWPAELAQHGPLEMLRGWSKAPRPAIAEEVNPCIEDCRTRIAAVDRELERFNVVAKVPVLQPLGSSLLSAQAEKPSTSSSFGLGEPAPEPPLAGSFSSAEKCEAILGDEMQGIDDFSSEEDLPAQLSVLEHQLLELDSKWQAVDEDRRHAQQQRDELATSLEARVAREAALESQVAALTTRLEEAEAKAKALSADLGVSEGEAQALRGRLEALERREQVLRYQANTLHAKLFVSCSEAEELHDRLGAARRGQEAAAAGLREAEDAQQEAAERQAAAAAGSLAGLRAQLSEELLAERAAAELREAALREALAAAEGRHVLAEEALAARAAVPEPAEALATLAAIPASEATTELDALAAPSFAGVPELLFASQLPAQGGLVPALQPVRCHFDFARSELRLQALAPTGPPCTLPLGHISSVARPESPRGVVDLELLSPQGLTPQAPHSSCSPQGPRSPELLASRRLRLAAANEHAASTLVAAISLPGRVLPGCSLEDEAGT